MSYPFRKMFLVLFVALFFYVPPSKAQTVAECYSYMPLPDWVFEGCLYGTLNSSTRSRLPDWDQDEIRNGQDFCPEQNTGETLATQVDSDEDGDGNLCDDSPCPEGHTYNATTNSCVASVVNNPPVINDIDRDGIADAVDNCPAISNVGQENDDGDHWGDACDSCYNEAAETANGCPAEEPTPVCDHLSKTDYDCDEILDDADNCWDGPDFEADQTDRDKDEHGDVCDENPLVPDLRSECVGENCGDEPTAKKRSGCSLNPNSSSDVSFEVFGVSLLLALFLLRRKRNLKLFILGVLIFIPFQSVFAQTPTSCRVATDCSAGSVCLIGQCLQGQGACRFSSECTGMNQLCYDNQCVVPPVTHLFSPNKNDYFFNYYQSQDDGEFYYEVSTPVFAGPGENYRSVQVNEQNFTLRLYSQPVPNRGSNRPCRFRTQNGNPRWLYCSFPEDYPLQNTALDITFVTWTLGTGSPSFTGQELLNHIPVDSDFDGIVDAEDNCNLVPNYRQEDSNGDGIGNSCDDSYHPDDPTDLDNDEILDCGADGDCATVGDNDNCPAVSNREQRDDDEDGIGNACDTGSECRPGQTYNPIADRCEGEPAEGSGSGDPEDPDGDGKVNTEDNCPAISNPGQENADGDPWGDVCDVCSDESANTVDGCPLRAERVEEECPHDNDDDYDCDGVKDIEDNCWGGPDFNADQTNTDGDEFGDICDEHPLVADVGSNCVGSNCGGGTTEKRRSSCSLNPAGTLRSGFSLLFFLGFILFRFLPFKKSL